MKFQNLQISINETDGGKSFVFEGMLFIEFLGSDQTLARSLAKDMGRRSPGKYKVEQHSGARVIICPIKTWSFDELIEQAKQRQHDFDVRLREIQHYRALRTILEEGEKVDAEHQQGR
jgi:hypothetical protein